MKTNDVSPSISHGSDSGSLIVKGEDKDLSISEQQTRMICYAERTLSLLYSTELFGSVLKGLRFCDGIFSHNRSRVFILRTKRFCLFYGIKLTSFLPLFTILAMIEACFIKQTPYNSIYAKTYTMKRSKIKGVR